MVGAAANLEMAGSWVPAFCMAVACGLLAAFLAIAVVKLLVAKRLAHTKLATAAAAAD